MRDNMGIRNEIKNLISMKQEGSYWDFKREWYSDNGDLLHDIICMANNLQNRDAYIIIGVDEENDYCLKDICDDINRKNTQNLVDFLKDKRFAGGTRPIVSVSSIDIDDCKIDVIVINNSYETPFYLTERYQKVNPNNIYTRIMDSNTPVNKSADLYYIEYLWKKRFRLISPPLEKFEYYLKNKEEWQLSPNGWESEKYFNVFSPEYIIEYTLEDNSNAYQFYLFNQTNTIPHWRKIRLYYHQTVLAEMEGVLLDGGRYFTPVPELDGISFNKFHHWDISYRYFIKNTLKYTIHNFFYNQDNDEEEYAHNRFLECILIFDDIMQKQRFYEYVLNNWTQWENYDVKDRMPYFPQIDNYVMSAFEEDFKNSLILKSMLDYFKLNE